MSRLDNVIKQVKEARKVSEKLRPWIYDDNGHIKNNVLCADTLYWLEELKEIGAEVEVTDDEIDYIIHHAEYSGNTYNGNCACSNDINWDKYGDKVVFMIHLYGDIRANYTEYFAIKQDYDYDWMTLESAIQYIDVPNTPMVADVNMFSEAYNVYDYDFNEDVGEFFTCDMDELIEEIKEARK